MQRIVQQYQNQIDQDNLKTYDENSDKNMSESDDDASLAERLAGIDLDAGIDDDKMAKVWDALTDKEREEFTALVNRQQIDSILTPWKPWWYGSKAPVISEITNNATEQTKKSAVPPVLAIGAPVKTLTNKVHPSVIFQLAQISLAYVYMMRHLDGEPYGNNLPVAFTDITTVSPLIASKVSDIYNNTHEALSVGFCNIDDTMDITSKCTLLSDLLAIYSKPAYVAAMVSDTYSITSSLISQEDLQFGLKKSKVKYAERRLYFIISIVKQMQTEVDPWEFMAADIALLKRRFESEAEAMKSSFNSNPGRF
ncbi:Zinc finger HIT domain-containing protein 2 [Coemansia brasiliensis]|uniref:Zinc finger HIT domain-containing protein 2 n=1 Tax=Coemansia brasiliensis TaxID=2650707 RepID=A0A9W8M123_9FUNG|nr:Zinc finger HIT domain-containing protein 2 [Coemansia brasiliensis]